jgi:hypothetical protein
LDEENPKHCWFGSGNWFLAHHNLHTVAMGRKECNKYSITFSGCRIFWILIVVGYDEIFKKFMQLTKFDP